MSCGSYGYAGADSSGQSIRLYTQSECTAMGGNWSHNGECLKKEGGSWSWDCRDLNNKTAISSTPLASVSQKAVEMVKSTLPASVSQSPYFMYGLGAVGLYVLFKLTK